MNGSAMTGNAADWAAEWVGQAMTVQSDEPAYVHVVTRYETSMLLFV